MIVACQENKSSLESEEEQNFKSLCGSCHLVPNPQNLTKSIWENSLLPRMGLFLGIPNSKVDHRQKLSKEEQEIITNHNIYPDEAIISQEEWNNLKEYIINLAPIKIEKDLTRINRNKNNDQFIVEHIPLDNLYGPTITAIEYDTINKQLWAADFNKQLYRWKNGKVQQIEMDENVVDFHFTNSGIVTTNIGELFPSDLKNGSLSLLQSTRKNELLKNLRRPVHSEYLDINNDGQKELIVAEYGHKIGGLFFYYKDGGEFSKKPILVYPEPLSFIFQI